MRLRWVLVVASSPLIPPLPRLSGSHRRGAGFDGCQLSYLVGTDRLPSGKIESDRQPDPAIVHRNNSKVISVLILR